MDSKEHARLVPLDINASDAYWFLPMDTNALAKTASNAGADASDSAGESKASMQAALAEAIELAGGRRALADEIGVTGSAISQWDTCPSNRALQVEKALIAQAEALEERA